MKVSFLHIGKTGGTALISTLRSIGNEDLAFHGHAFTLEGLWQKFPNRKAIFGVREPVSRFVSAFNSRLREGLPRHHTPWSKLEAIAFSFFKTPNELAEALSSDNPHEKALAECAMHGIQHVNKPLSFYLGSADFLRENRKKIRFVYLQETLDGDFELMKKLLELPADMALPKDEVAAHRAPEGMSKKLTERGEANIRRWYHDDFDIMAACREIHDARVREFESAAAA